MRRAAAVEDTHDRPVAFAEEHGVADVGIGKTLVNGLADHHLTLPRTKPAALSDFDVRPQLESDRRKKPHRDIGFAGAVLPREHDYQNGFAGNQWLATAVFRNSRQVLDGLHGL